MPIGEDGLFLPEGINVIQARLYNALRTQFGDKVDLNVGSPLAKFAETLFAIQIGRYQVEMADVFAQMFPSSARGTALDLALELFGSRKSPAPANGKVNINFSSLPTSPVPFITVGDAFFVGTDGDFYELSSDIELPSEVFDGSAFTAVPSETIDATTTRIAQKFTTVGVEYIQAFRATATHVSGTPTFTVSIQTDAAGSPSGTLAAPSLTKTGFLPANGTETAGLWTEGANLPTGDYWLIFERTAGAATFDGAVSGDADQVKFYNGTWNLSATVENTNVDVVTGGIAEIEAQLSGASFNAVAESINTIRFPAPAAETTWATYVSSFTNLDSIEGGADQETDSAYLLRIRNSVAGRETASLDGIVLAVRNVPGVRGATGAENITEDGGDQNKVFDSNETGTGSDDVDGAALYQIAQKIVTTESRFVQRFGLVANHVLGTPTASVSLQTDNAGEPSGTLAFVGAETDGPVTLANGTSTVGLFKKGQYLTAGTYWVVVTQAADTFDLDGGTGGTADQVLVDSGGVGSEVWALDTAIENANLELIGGIPPHGFRIFASGGDVDDIAQAIHANKPAGIRDDGLTEGDAINALGVTVSRFFDRPDLIPVVFQIEVETNATFGGDGDTIRDAVVAYVGGVDTKGATVEGLEVAGRLTRNRIIDNIMEIPGVEDVTLLYLGRRVDFATPAALTATEVINLSAGASEEFVVDIVADDISVVIA